MKIPREKANSGQTLIEPLLAIAILGLVLAPFISSIGNLAYSQVKYRHQTEAVQYARGELETIYNAAANTDDWEDFVTNHLGTTSLPEGRFTRETTIAKAKRDTTSHNINEDTGEEDDNTLRVVSKVTWDERGQSQEVELTTYLISFKVFGE